MRAVAERLVCEIVLTLADVHETWSCEDDYEPYYRSHSYRDYDDYDDHDAYEDDDGDAYGETSGDDGYSLIEIIEDDIELRKCIGVDSKKPAPVSASVGRKELCFTRPSAEMEPFQSDHEGYMGNWGNTVDRWYHRAAVVLWPRERSFVIGAKASPSMAMKEVAKLVARGALAEARSKVESLLPFWDRVAPFEQERGFAKRTLRVAAGVESRPAAAALLRPLKLEQIGPDAAPDCAAVLVRYGIDSMQELFGAWVADGAVNEENRGRWLERLPAFCEALGRDEAALTLGRWLLGHQWAWLDRRHAAARNEARRARLERLTSPILAVLESTLVVKAPELRQRIIERLRSIDEEPEVGSLVRLLRAERSNHSSDRIGLAPIHEHCTKKLSAWTNTPPRSKDDWSILARLGCTCKLCATLGAFLTSPQRRELEWPLAKEGRAHVHRTIDRLELPVAHTTRRRGSPLYAHPDQDRRTLRRGSGTSRRMAEGSRVARGGEGVVRPG